MRFESYRLSSILAACLLVPVQVFRLSYPNYVRPLALVLLLGACFFGCSHAPRQNRVDRQDKAGSVHVSVMSVAPWEDYSEILQPVFKLTADEALAQAVPNTVAIEEKLLDAFGAKVKAALPTTGTTSTTTTTTPSSGDPQTSGTSTTQAAPGAVSTVSFGAVPAGTATASGLPPSTSVLGSSLGIDPLMRYKVAKALFEEVGIINQEIKNAAIDPDRYKAYVVRLQITLLPKQRDEPYDAYANISFFNGNFGPGSLPAKTVTETQASLSFAEDKDGLTARSTFKNRVDQLPQSPVRQRLQHWEKTTLAKAQSTPELAAQVEQLMAVINREYTSDGEAPKVIPMLVTDSIVSAIQSHSQERIIQLGLALSGMINGIGVGADLQKTSDRLRTSLGRDFNSTFTIGRLSENTIRARLGAVQQSAGTYATVPQNHQISLVLLVPKDSSKTVQRVVSRTTFVDAVDGHVLPARDAAEVQSTARSIVKAYLKNNGVIELKEINEWTGALVGHAERNEYASFVAKISAVPNIPSVLKVLPESLWLDLVELRIGSQYDATTFSLPTKPKQSQKLPTQTATLVDDGKSATVTTLQGATGWKTKQLFAKLTIAQQSPRPTVDLLPRTISTAELGATVAMTFPSLKSLGLIPDPKNPPEISISLVGTQENQEMKLHENGKVLYLEKPAANDTIKMSVSSRAINSEKGLGKVQITFAKVAKKTTIAVDGAYVVTANVAPPLKLDPSGIPYVDAPCTVELALANLTSRSDVTISADDGDGPAIKEIRPVIELPVVK
jgi:hypothetical protein